MSLNDLDTAAAALQGGAVLCDDILSLRLGKCSIRIRSNSPELLAHLGKYFAHVVAREEAPDIEVIAIERAVVDLDVPFTDWARDPGKIGLKDAYHNLPQGRLLKKIRTGMLFLQSESWRIAAGPCRRNFHQVTNFINAQYMNWLQNRGFLICHAAGLVCNGQAFGIAGFSSGSKSALMLRLLGHREVDYLTNDRLFIRATSGTPLAVGTAKLPRVNSATLLYSPRLQSQISPEKRERWLALSPKELWQLTEKHDLDVARAYGPGRIVRKAPLGAFIILNWDSESQEPPVITQVNLAVRRDLLGAIMQSPGPFYQYADGSFFQDGTELDEETYLNGLLGVSVYEVRGGEDFDAVCDTVLRDFLQ